MSPLALQSAGMIGEDEARLREARALIQEINLGATAIGTGINAPAGYAEIVCRHLAEECGVPVEKAANLIEATQDTGAFVQLSGVLKRVATKLSKICNDLRLLSSGPQAGFGDIRLPPRQAGSSIMAARNVRSTSLACCALRMDVGGKILEDCTKDEFFNHPENRKPRTKDFLNKILSH